MKRSLLNILRRIGRWVFDELLARARRWKKASEWIRSSGATAAREVTREAVDAIPYLSAYETVE